MASFTVNIPTGQYPTVTAALAQVYGYTGANTLTAMTTFVCSAIAEQLIAQAHGVLSDKAQASYLAAFRPPTPPTITITAG